MDFLRILRRNLDITSTPLAPKIGKIPLPEVDDSTDDYVIPRMPCIEDDDYSESDQPILRAPTPRKPIRVFDPSISSPSTSRTSSPRISTPVIPKWKTLRDPSARKLATPETESNLKAKPSRTSSPVIPSHAPQRKVSPTGSDTSYKQPLKSILKPASKQPLPEEVLLHWQLIPYDPELRKSPVHFDVSAAAMEVRFDSVNPTYRIHLTKEQLDKKAAGNNVHLTKMTIRCEQLEHWKLVVENPDGITCGDVFKVIHETYHVPLTTEEIKLYISRRRRTACEEAFSRRCRRNPEVRRKGIMRIDLLQDNYMFKGLKRPPNANDNQWVLEFGKPLHL